MTHSFAPEFTLFIERLLTASGQISFKEYLPRDVDETLQSFLAGEKLNKDQNNSLAYLEKEYELLGINKLSLDQIQTLPVTYAESRSCGWGIQSPVNSAFIRFSYETDLSFFNMPVQEPRPNILASVNNLRYNYDTKTAIETHPLVNGITYIPALFQDKTAYHLAKFNLKMIKHCGYNPFLLRENNLSDFGVRFFSKQKTSFFSMKKNPWQAVPFADCQKITKIKDNFVTADGQHVIPVPFLFDTESLKRTEVPIEKQRANLEALLSNKSALKEKCIPELSTNLQYNMIECYLDFEKQTQQKRSDLNTFEY